MGTYGFPSRALARRMGSLFCYTSFDSPEMPLAAPGQTTPDSFISVYRGKETGPKSSLYALLGSKSILNSLSPSIHNNRVQEYGEGRAHRSLSFRID